MLSRRMEDKSRDQARENDLTGNYTIVGAINGRNDPAGNPIRTEVMVNFDDGRTVDGNHLADPKPPAEILRIARSTLETSRGV